MKTTKFWVILFAAVFLLSAGTAAFLLRYSSGGTVANVYHHGKLIYRIDIARVESAYELKVSGEVENTIAVENGRICVISATCPDQVCVRQGWISGGVVPVVCLPNSLVIQIEDTPEDEVDVIVR